MSEFKSGRYEIVTIKCSFSRPFFFLSLKVNTNVLFSKAAKCWLLIAYNSICVSILTLSVAFHSRPSSLCSTVKNRWPQDHPGNACYC